MSVVQPDSSAFKRPLWVLCGDGMPVKVEMDGKRKKILLPSGVTHWCHEGDVVWCPLWREKPPGVAFAPKEATP